MAIEIAQLHHVDVLNYIAEFLETAKLLSSLESGDQLALELVDFAQKVAQEAAQTS